MPRYYDALPIRENGSPGRASLGSGVIMSEDGHIITNRHVIDGAQAIQILLSDGRRANAMVVGADPETDLALLKLI